MMICFNDDFQQMLTKNLKNSQDKRTKDKKELAALGNRTPLSGFTL